MMASSASSSMPPPPRRVTIIGAGISGLTCARTLVELAPDPGPLCLTLLEKSTSHGRCATREVPSLSGSVSFDHGAPGFEATTTEFRAQVQAWRAENAVVPFADNERTYLRHYYRGHPTMRSLPLHLARGLGIRRPVLIERIARAAAGGGGGWVLYPQGGVEDAATWEADALVVAVPPEQSAALLEGVPGAEALHAAAAAVRSDPCITVLLAVPAASEGNEKEEEIVHFPVGTNRVLAKAVRRRQGVFDCWVAHTTVSFSHQYIHTPAEAFQKTVVLETVLAAMRTAGLVGGDVVHAHMDAHRWLYAQTSGPVMQGSQKCGWEPGLQLGVCGDGWGEEGLQGVERAWLSGRALGTAMAEAWWGKT